MDTVLDFGTLEVPFLDSIALDIPRASESGHPAVRKWAQSALQRKLVFSWHVACD